MLKTIILVRHGKTKKDKSNPERSLTLRGKKQLKNTSEQIKKLISGSFKIVSTDTKRTQQSAKILSKILGVNFEITDINLRVNNFNLIEEKFGKSTNLIFKYFKEFEDGNLDSKVTSPIEVLKRFNYLINKYKCQNLIVVGHSAALESFVEYQDSFQPKNKFKNELKYGEFIVLTSSKC